MASDRVRDLKALLDQLAASVEWDDRATAEDRALRNEALGRFIAGGAPLLGEATPFLWAYYRHTAAEFTFEERARYGIPEIPARRTSGNTSSSHTLRSGVPAAAR